MRGCDWFPATLHVCGTARDLFGFVVLFDQLSCRVVVPCGYAVIIGVVFCAALQASAAAVREEFVVGVIDSFRRLCTVLAAAARKGQTPLCHVCGL